MRPTSPRGAIPRPIASDSRADIFERRAGIQQPMTFAPIATTKRTIPNTIRSGVLRTTHRFTSNPMEMKKIGVKTAPR